jgi:hypothetical protein
MTNSKTLCARVGASAIVAALALSPIHAAVPKPIVDLSKSPAVSGAATPAKQATKAKPMIGPFDERTAAELGGGAIALLALSLGGLALSRRKTRENAEWNEEPSIDERRDPLFDEPMFKHEPMTADASAFGSGNPADSLHETWVERAHRGPTPDNPSLSLRARLKRAAFFDKREREAAAGNAVPVDADAGLPEAMIEEQDLEAA